MLLAVRTIIASVRTGHQSQPFNYGQDPARTNLHAHSTAIASMRIDDGQKRLAFTGVHI
jgi:hypothetical protein